MALGELLLIYLGGAPHWFYRRLLFDTLIRVLFTLPICFPVDTTDLISRTVGAFGAQLCAM